MLELAGVGHGFRADHWLFRDVTVRLPPGSVTTVLGPNGRGKTTLLRCAAGLLHPREGVVRHGDVTAVGYVPQAQTSTFGYRVLDMVLMGRVRHVGMFGTPRRSDHAAAWAAMGRVGVDELAYRAFSTLSGGEAQLVRVARAVASGGDVLALDEPATGLDLHNQARVLRLLRELADGGIAVLATTHHPEHALAVADHVVLMMPTDVLAGPAADLLTDARLSELYGIEVRTISYDDGGAVRRGLISRYDGSDRPFGRTSSG